MPDYIFLMQDDAVVDDEAAWEPCLRTPRQAGVFHGGSEIGDGVCVSKGCMPAPLTRHLTGFIRVTARDLDRAKVLLTGSPVYEAGGTIEIRELPLSD